MFHLPSMTLAFPLRGACQHNSSCHRPFARGTGASQALLTCGLLTRGDFPSGLDEWMDVLVSDLASTGQEEPESELSRWEDSLGAQLQAQAALAWSTDPPTSSVLSLNPNGNK